MALPYLFLTFFICFVTLIQHGKKQSVGLFHLCMVVLLLFCVIKDPTIYRDYSNYISYFLTGHYEDESEFTEDSINIGFVVINKIIRSFTDHFFIFDAIVAILLILTPLKFIKNYSSNVYISLLIYYLTLYYSFFWLLRQGLATAFVIMSMPYIIKKDLKKFILFILLGVSMHMSALAFLPMYFLYNIPRKKSYEIALCISMIVITVCLQLIATRLFAFSAYYSTYLDREYEASLIRLFMVTYIIIIYVIVLKEKVFERNWNFLLFLCISAKFILYFGSSGIDGIYRVKLYFDIADTLAVPLLLREASLSKHRIGYKMLIYIYIILLFMSCYSFLTGGNFEFGYKTIF